jgi:thymidylate synthase (FAD)
MHKVSVVGITQPLVEGVKSADDFIAYCARVSNPSNQLNAGTADKLIKYLVKNRHWSPFEMVNVVMEIETTRDIARQILRHRSFAFQEFSQRYAVVDGSSFDTRTARYQDTKNRQNSTELDLSIAEDIELYEWWEEMQRKVLSQTRKIYNEAIDHGVAKEVARAILPEGMTMSRLYMNGSLRSWFHYCDLRMGNGTQLEHRLIAKDCWDQIEVMFPSLQGIFESQ